MKTLALILVSLVIRLCSTAVMDSTGSPDTLECKRRCPFVPCSIAKCPRLPTAECQNDYCNGCNHKYYLNGSDVTALCDPCSSMKCPPQTVCYFDSYNVPYCAQPCKNKITCPAGYLCRANSLKFAYSVRCLEGSCGYSQSGLCVKMEEGSLTVKV